MASNLKRRSASEPLGASPAGGAALQSTVLDKVFTYGIMAMRGSRFAHLGIVADGSGG
jgi:hypothetical protein